jgi:[acyl-carrier-protein] S-malonyltransferase
VKAPQIPVVNNIDVAVVSDPAAIKRRAGAPGRRPGALGRVRAAHRRHGRHARDRVRPGKVLAGLTKRIDGNLVGASVFDPASLDEALKLATA